jgi:putative ABC transport system permease protein
LLTFLGALLGLAFTLILVYGFKDFLMHTLFHTNGASINLSINFGLFIISLIASLVLSILSGLIPAIKMSKIQPAEVLKGGEL